ncbi:MAG TPA: phosphoglucosamine mutase [Bacteroidales bacterium]|nr:phosphoglucosamine mutase [Bacteroidales bacterium]
MSLIRSISGIRGTIGGKQGEALTPYDIIKFTSAFVEFLRNVEKKEKLKIVIGRDARNSGVMVSHLVTGTLLSLGVDIVDLNLSTTPTVEIAVVEENADGGIIITASHNPKNWNALKLLNNKGEFISAEEGSMLLDIADKGVFIFNEVDKLGSYTQNINYINKHIEKILKLPLINKKAIEKSNFKIAVDAVNSTGGVSVIPLLKALGVNQIYPLFCEPTGIFPHNPEPLPENLNEIADFVVRKKADLGFVVDPDVDRLAIVCENGDMFGEEYTLVSIADYVLSHKKGNTVSNLSSTRALRDITLKHGCEYFESAVGEVNVVKKMKEVNAVIGGEGNGGVIYPELHYGRDALIGIALFLSHLATSKLLCSHLREKYPDYFISKNKIELTSNINITDIFDKLKNKYKNNQINNIDGIKIIFDKEWVHLRRSNTEMIIRIYAESDSINKAEHLAKKIIEDIKEIIRNQVLKNLENN